MLSLAFRLLTVVLVTTALVACSGVPQATVQGECYDCDWPGWPVTDGTQKPITDTTDEEVTDTTTKWSPLKPVRVYVDFWQFGERVTMFSASNPATLSVTAENPNSVTLYCNMQCDSSKETAYAIYSGSNRVAYTSGGGLCLMMVTPAIVEPGSRPLLTWGSGFTAGTVANWGPFPASFTAVAEPRFRMCNDWRATVDIYARAFTVTP